MSHSEHIAPDAVAPTMLTTPASPHRLSARTALFALPLLMGSALLFLVQPMFGKMVLPRLGGSPAVWNTCMLFFQACLLAGYAYAHALTRLPLRRQAMIHSFALLLPIVALPMALPAWTPPASADPAPWLLAVLTVSVGLPFFVVSATSPLVQAWFHRAGERAGGQGDDAAAQDPYFLYAASNAGSMAGLLAYPLIVEPTLRLRQQATWWAAGYAVLAATILACALATARATTAAAVRREERSDFPSAESAAGRDAVPASIAPRDASDEVLPAALQLRWIVLAFIPSSYLLGVTTFVTSDIAAVPLLWVVPLAIYLLTLVIAFSRRPLVPHRGAMRALPVTTLVAVTFFMARAAQPVGMVMAVHLLAFFVAALACHGELARLRPHPRHLTRFYLMMSVGGAVGGAFNALVAPVLFAQPTEYPLAIALAAMVRPMRAAGAAAAVRAPSLRRLDRALDVVLPAIVGALAWPAVSAAPARTVPGTYLLVFLVLSPPVLLCLTFVRRPRRFALGVAALVLAFTLATPAHARLRDVRRSFFGVHRVLQTADRSFNQLFHGTTLHGLQRLDPATAAPAHADRPTSYYHPSGPVGDVFAHALAPGRLRHVGVVGLGAGAMTAHARGGARWSCYEIDPAVQRLAEDPRHFTYLPAARQRGADVRVVLGDARLTLAAADDGAFDLLALDAFSGDAMPVHLLTREALATYRRKLAPRGVLLVNISNLYVDLKPVLANLAADAGWACATRDDPDVSAAQLKDGKQASEFAVMAESEADLSPLLRTGRWKLLARFPSHRTWTDDYSNVLGVLKWRRR